MAESLVLIDKVGLSTSPDTTIELLGLNGTVITEDVRLRYLARLVKAKNTTIVTGGIGAHFFSVAANGVLVRIEPDGVESKYRTSIREWAAHQVCDEGTAKKLLIRKKPPTRGALVQPWQDMLELEERFQAMVAEAEPLGEGEQVDITDESVLDTNELLALDWEWQISDKQPVGLAISNAEANYYMPVRARDVVFRTTEESRGAFSNALRRGVPTVFHNGRADIGTQYDGDPIELFGKPIDDTLLMAYLADPDSADLGLKSLTTKYLGRHATPYPGNVEELDVETAAQYAAGSDTRNTYDLRRVLVNELIRTKQWKLYTEIERPLVPIIASMEKYGVPVDITKVMETYREYVTIESGLVGKYREEGYDIRKDPDLRRLLTDELGYDPGTLDQRVLSGYREGIIDLALFYRRTRTRRNNFLRRLIREWKSSNRPHDFRVYPSYNQAGRSSQDGFARAPRTGRLSSSNPNFQQQPRDLRYIYIAPRGYKWFKYDYSQLELRLAANLSGDTNLTNDLLSGDPHGVFREYIRTTTGRDPGRPTAKTANFEKLYFGGDAQLVRVLQKERVFIDISLAKLIGQAHASRYAGYYAYAQEVVQDARRNSNEVRTALGRRRKVAELQSSDPTLSQHGERAAINHTVQGYAADLVKKVMVMLVPVMQKYGAHIAVQVHDELDGFVPESVDLVAFDRDVRECMQSLNVGTVPLLVDGGIKDSWAG